MAAPSRPTPAALVRRELRRAAGDALLFPARLALAALRGGAARAELRAALDVPAAPAPLPRITWRTDRPLLILVSCAEVSGETHAVNLVQALREEARAAGAPEPRFAGLGGARLRAAGVEVWHDTVTNARMGLFAALRSLGHYKKLLADTLGRSDAFAPDAAVAIDSPALHVPLMSMLHARGVPVAHFVVPQHWAWAPWRARRWAACVDLGLAILPFEPAWFARRGAQVVLVGHPQLDAVDDDLRRSAAASSKLDSPREALVVLCGSRRSLLARHARWMADIAVEAARGTRLEVVVAHEREEVASQLRALLADRIAAGVLRVQSGGLHALLEHARAALTVSGTITVDLMARGTPTVVVYRVAGRLEALLARALVQTPYIASPNLLAGAEVMPEHAFAGEPPRERILADLRRAAFDAQWRARCQAQLEAACARLGGRGAVRRAALHVAALAHRPRA